MHLQTTSSSRARVRCFRHGPGGRSHQARTFTWRSDLSSWTMPGSTADRLPASPARTVRICGSKWSRDQPCRGTILPTLKLQATATGAGRATSSNREDSSPSDTAVSRSARAAAS